MHNLLKNPRNFVLALAAIAFFGGSGYIMYAGRPAVKNAQTGQLAVNAPADASYALDDVAAHATPDSCWTAIRGNVYDLTSWISRHPGGPEAIQGLCGKDGTTAFNDMHGTQRRPAATLVLLKIGQLK